MEIKKKMDMGAAVFLLLAMGFLYQQTTEFSSGLFSTNSPQFFPLLMIGLISILSLCLLFSSISINDPAEKGPCQTNAFRLSSGMILQLFTVLFLGLYIVLLPILSYIPSTLLFLFLTMAALGGQRDFRTLATYFCISCITTGVLYFIFAHMLQLFLP